MFQPVVRQNDVVLKSYLESGSFFLNIDSSRQHTTTTTTTITTTTTTTNNNNPIPDDCVETKTEAIYVL